MFMCNQIINFFRCSGVIGDADVATASSNGEINAAERYCLKNFEN